MAIEGLSVVESRVALTRDPSADRIVSNEITSTDESERPTEVRPSDRVRKAEPAGYHHEEATRSAPRCATRRVMRRPVQRPHA